MTADTNPCEVTVSLPEGTHVLRLERESLWVTGLRRDGTNLILTVTDGTISQDVIIETPESDVDG